MRITLSSAFSALGAMALIATAVAGGIAQTQAQAESRLIPNGITTSHTGNCINRNNPSYTSYEDLLSSTIDAVITLKKASGCSNLVITGGIEIGHGSGQFSHTNGHKLDLLSAFAIDCAREKIAMVPLEP
ncbi:hypothetical protein BGZ92_001504 [Podila epicladia]|nr:hypothetical protein BGZ92_001504 [Podila epicladia]